MKTVHDLQVALNNVEVDTKTLLDNLAARDANGHDVGTAVDPAIDDAVNRLDALDATIKAADPGPQSPPVPGTPVVPGTPATPPGVVQGPGPVPGVVPAAPPVAAGDDGQGSAVLPPPQIPTA